jgi:hypothetical protein
MSSSDYIRAYKAWLKNKATLKKKEKQFDIVLGSPKHNARNEIDPNNVYNRYPIPAPLIPQHLMMDPPADEYQNVVVPKSVFKKVIDALDSIARTTPPDGYEADKQIRNAFGGKSRKQPRKTKARRNHRKRTQRK